MKAAVYYKYGKPEVVSVGEVPAPKCGNNEILIQVKYASVNRTDAGFRSAEYVISRLFSGLFKPYNPVLGCEFSGVVTQIGAEVTNFNVGDRVYGFDDAKFGGHAEFKVMKENDAVCVIPENVDFETAAATSEGSHYALCNIRAANVQKGQKVLVYGATGAIGSAAVQLLKHFGATVTAVCRKEHLELVKSLGADVVLDYQTQDYTKTNERYHFVFDAVGKSSFGQSKLVLLDGGIYISTELGKNGENVYKAISTKFIGKKRLMFPLPITKKEDIKFLGDLVSAGTFKPLIDRVYALNDIVEAYTYVDSGQKVGNVLLRLQD
jgi:NADPH:quinone reductase-like Zn-dependent oxidoreductase